MGQSSAIGLKLDVLETTVPSMLYVDRHSSFHLNLVRFEEIWEVEDVFQTGYMIVSI